MTQPVAKALQFVLIILSHSKISDGLCSFHQLLTAVHSHSCLATMLIDATRTIDLRSKINVNI